MSARAPGTTDSGTLDRAHGAARCDNARMKILVAAASRHGATREVADAIGKRLREDGLDVERRSPEQVSSLTGYDGVVIGSAVYMTRWLSQANAFLERFHDSLGRVPVWAFSVGLSGVPKHQPQDPSRIGPARSSEHIDNQVAFAGRYDPSLLSLRERSVARLAGAVEGDFRDWDAIAKFADSVSEAVKARETH